MFYDSIQDFLGFNARPLYEEYNLSNNRVDILSFDKIFLRTNISQGMIFRRKRSGIIFNFSMEVDPGYTYVEKIRGGVQWYMAKRKDIISSIYFK